MSVGQICFFSRHLVCTNMPQAGGVLDVSARGIRVNQSLGRAVTSGHQPASGMGVQGAYWLDSQRRRYAFFRYGNGH